MSLKDDDDLVIETDEVDVDNTEEEEVIENADTPDEEESPETIQDEEDDEEDRVVTIGDEVPEESEEDLLPEVDDEHPDKKDLVKKLRKVTRGLEKKAKALEKEKKLLERQLEAKAKATEIEKPVELGEKPTLKDCGYDDKKYEQELFNYYERKKRVDEQAAEKERLVQQQTKAWEEKQSKYVNLKQEHSFKDFSYAEELVTETLSTTQQGIIVQGAEDSALLVYALGKNPKKLEELSKVSDPVDFAFKVAKLESQLKVTNKKAPAPEKRVSTGKSGGISGSADKTLARLRAEAEKTSDYTKVTAYKRKLRNKG